jgi:WD40 repeat protein
MTDQQYPQKPASTESHTNINGGVNLDAQRDVDIDGDVVGRDKIVGDDEVHGDQQVINVEAGGIVVAKGGRLTNIHVPRAVQIAVGVAVLAFVVLVIKAVTPTPASAKVNTEFVFDASSAMAQSERWSIAQTVFGDQATYATRREQLALRTVGGGCTVPADPTVPLGTDQADRLVNVVKGLKPQGDAALVESVKAAADDLPVDADAQNTIILVSAGEDTCLIKAQKDPCVAMSAVADSLKRAGIKFTLHVVALQAGESARQQLTCLAKAAATGYFYQANSVDDLQKVLHQIENQAAPVAAAEGTSGRSLEVDSTIASVMWTPDGKRILAGVDNGMVSWDIDTNQSATSAIKGAPNCCSWLSPDGQQIATIDDGAIHIWSNAAGEVVLKDNLAAGYSLAWSPDGKQLASGSNQLAAGVWDVASGKLVQKLAGHTRPVVAVAWSPDGKRLATGGGDGKVRLWQVDEARLLQELSESGFYGRAAGLAWSPDGTQFASIANGDAIRIWDVAIGREIATIPVESKPDGGGLNQIVWSPDGNYIATASTLGNAALVDVPGQRSLEIMTDGITALAWSPDGKHLATGGFVIENGGRSSRHFIQLWPMPPASR